MSRISPGRTRGNKRRHTVARGGGRIRVYKGPPLSLRSGVLLYLSGPRVLPRALARAHT